MLGGACRRAGRESPARFGGEVSAGGMGTQVDCAVGPLPIRLAR